MAALETQDSVFYFYFSRVFLLCFDNRLKVIFTFIKFVRINLLENQAWLCCKYVDI